MPPSKAIASSLRTSHLSTMAKNASIPGWLRRARVAASAKSGNFRKSKPRSGSTANAFPVNSNYVANYLLFWTYGQGKNLPCFHRHTGVSLLRCRSRRRLLTSPTQLLQVFVTGLDAVERSSGLVVFDDIVFDPRLLGLREDALPVDDAATYFCQVHSVSKILRATGCDLGKGLDVLDVDQRESTRVTIKILKRISASDGDPAEVELHLDQVGITCFEENIVR